MPKGHTLTQFCGTCHDRNSFDGDYDKCGIKSIDIGE